jgi:cell division protein FtsL
MQENTLQSLVPKASRTPFFLSIFFVGLVITASIIIFIMDRSTKGNIRDIESQISAKNAEISEIKKDKRVIITNILKSGTVKPSLDLR